MHIVDNLVENLIKFKLYYLLELVVMAITIRFIWILHVYNQLIYIIRINYSDQVIQTLKVMSEPHYFNYLLGGGFFIFLLVVFTLFVIKTKIGINGGIFLGINLILLIILLITFWNPVLATFAILLIGGGSFVMASSY